MGLQGSFEPSQVHLLLKQGEQLREGTGSVLPSFLLWGALCLV